MTEAIVAPRKPCSRCKRKLPAKFPYYNRNKNKKSGFEYHCRGCKYGWSDNRFQAEILSFALLGRGYKQCKDCSDIKPLSEFPKSKSCLGGRRPECRECHNNDQREYWHKPEIQSKQKEHNRREAVRARHRAWENRPEHKLRKSEYDKSPERKAIRREQNKRADVKARRRQYYQRLDIREKQNKYNRERYHQNERVKALTRANRQIRRARLLSLPKDYSATDWQKAIEYFGGCCAVCGRQPEPPLTLAADHWIPLAKGGATIPTNIVPLCHSLKGGARSCNRNKWHKDPYQWLVEKYGELKAQEIERRIQGYFSWLVKQNGQSD